ncbi:MAG: DEAD/DEAH box helicase [Deltaproteobacteria bacterium]|nr:DEAD/DEAH box helicase [Deltaproteobacteria bacterium]
MTPTRQAAEPGFDGLGLSSALLRAVADAGYEHPTPIQRRAIPPVAEGRDLVGCAQTGTGKTAAFALPVLDYLDAVAEEAPRLRALVITPTRELAAQIGASFETYGRHLDIRHTVIFGGVKDKPQIRTLRRGVDAIIATPGRLLDLMSRGEIDLGGIEIFVLDEADRMLDMGFLPDVRRITARLPKKRQTLFFSATMPRPIRALAEGLLRDPVSVNADKVSAPAVGVEHRLYFVDKVNKRRLLVDLLAGEELSKTLVFSRTKHGANNIVRVLDKAGIDGVAIHGNKSQNARVRALEGFRRGDTRVLVATDIAARGIDIEGVTHVINFDLPNVPETYVHRIGRTARAGASGFALSLCCPEERPLLADIERLIGRGLMRVDDHPRRSTQASPTAVDVPPNRPAQRVRPPQPRDNAPRLGSPRRATTARDARRPGPGDGGVQQMCRSTSHHGSGAQRNRKRPPIGAVQRKSEHTMSKKLFVGGLSWDTDDSGLRNAFEQFGDIDEAAVITDRDSGRSRGFGFVTYANDADATEAIEAMNGTELDGRALRVDAAQEKSRRSPGRQGLL